MSDVSENEDARPGRGVDYVLSVSPLTGVVYAVSEYEEAGDEGKIISKQKRELDRDEIDPDRLHLPARRAYQLFGGESS